LGHRVFNLTVNIPHTNFVVFTYAHQKWQNSQSDDGDRSTEEEEEGLLYDTGYERHITTKEMLLILRV